MFRTLEKHKFVIFTQQLSHQGTHLLFIYAISLENNFNGNSASSGVEKINSIMMRRKISINNENNKRIFMNNDNHQYDISIEEISSFVLIIKLS